MKRIVQSFICLVLIVTFLSFDVIASDESFENPIVLDFSITTELNEVDINENNETRATGLINSYSLTLSKSGTTLNIGGTTYAATDAVKCGFKNLIIERRASSDDSWEEYYDYGNVYADGIYANLSTTLVVASGYQYRISCKHYAKKNILSVQTIANTSNIVTVS